AADLNGDGNVDVVSCNIIEGIGNSTNVLLGNGDGTFAPAVSYGDINTDARAIALGDMDNDGDIDIVLPNGSRGMLNNGDGTFYTNYVGSDVTAGGTIALGDLNEDGHLDIVTARDFYHPNDDFVSVQLGTGDGSGNPGPPFHLPIGGYSPWRVRLADFSDDGHLDLVTINQASQDMSFLLGNGDGTFGSPVTLAVSDASTISPNVITIDDYDGDGLPDAAVTSTVYGDGSSHQETSILLLNERTGSFDLVQTIVRFGQYSENITPADLDTDGDTDLATATHLLLNLTDPSCPGDLDGDGDVDLADLAALLASYGLCDGDPGYDPAADIDDSGCVDLSDLATLLAVYGTSCP
ncbi:MAG: FG-GAP repeat domain-containing protein, partial [Planctomycetota bacterium]